MSCMQVWLRIQNKYEGSALWTNDMFYKFQSKVLFDFFTQNFKVTDFLGLNVSFNFFVNLGVQIYYQNEFVGMSSFEGLLGPEHKCNKWTFFEVIRLWGKHKNTVRKKHCIIEHFRICLNDINYNDHKYLKLKIIELRDLLLSMKRLRYSCKFILWCLKFYFSFHNAYILIHNSTVLTTLSPSYLIKLTNLVNSATNSYESLKS